MTILRDILRDDDAYESMCDLPPQYSRHRMKIIAAATAAERERCAKIAAQHIAARIRSGE